MTKHQLATQLRQRQHAMGEAEPWMIDALSDDDIIDCYITCSCCGEKQVEGYRLEVVIAKARNADHFFDICNEVATPRDHRRGRPN